MVGSKWIKISVILTLLLLLQVSAADQSQLVENGSNTTLSCKNLMGDQNECINTTWLFSSSRGAAIELITLGRIGKQVGNKSHRLHVVENCSLGIKNIAAEDVGIYTCRQYLSDQKQGQDTRVELSVVTMTEEMSRDRATLTCCVDTYGRCKLSVELLFSGTNEQRNLKAGQYYCQSSMELMSYDHRYKDRFNSLKCKVRDGKVMQEFAFRPRPSVRKTETTTQSTKATELTAAPHNAPTNLKDWWWLFVVVAVILAALLITCVTVLLCKRKKGESTNESFRELHMKQTLSSEPSNKGNKTLTTETANHEDGVFYSSLSFTRVGKGRVLGKNDESESEAVTYSTVKSSSMDPSHVYASINSPS